MSESSDRSFESSRAALWRELAQQLQGTYVQGNFWSGDKIEISSPPWTITLDAMNVPMGVSPSWMTRLRAPFVNKDGLRFRLYRTGFATELAKAFGMQDVTIGDKEFDDAYVVKSNDEAKVKQLLADEKIRKLLLAQPDVRFEVKSDEGWFAKHFPEGVDELYCAAEGVLKDIDKLKQLYELFAETLQQLCRIGAATPGDPGIKL